MKKLVVFIVLIACIAVFYGANKFLVRKQGSADVHPGLTTWQEQLEHAKNPAHADGRAGSGFDELVLEDYQCIGTIDSESEKAFIVDRILSDSAHMVTYITDPNSADIVATIGEMREIAGQRGDNSYEEWLESLRAQLMELPLGIEVIELRWAYKGEVYYSVALASNEDGGILYENIGYLMIDPKSIG